MKTVNLEVLRTEELIQEFIRIAQERGAAVLDSETRKANRMLSEMQAVDRVLRSRGQQARMALSPLLDNKERFVRYYAAKYLLAAMPGRARQVIEDVAEPKADAICLDAGMCLYALDKGIFKPD